MSTNIATYISPEEYLDRERAAETRSEWIDGEIREMVGGSHRHSTIAWNIAGELRRLLKGRPFSAHQSDMRVRIPDGPYYYPDVTVAPDPPELEDDRKDTLLNPRLIFEVLSPSTEAIDQGTKLDNYRSISTLTDYLLVAQDTPRIDHYHRREDAWRLEIIMEPAASLHLPEIGCELPLAEIYDRVVSTESDAV